MIQGLKESEQKTERFISFVGDKMFAPLKIFIINQL